MPATSIKQQKFMGLVLAYKRGEIPASKVTKNVKQVADSMSEKELEKYAGTKHRGLPNKVKSELRIPVSELKRMVKEAVSQVINEEKEPSHGEQEVKLTPEEKTKYMESILRFNEYGSQIYRSTDIEETLKNIKKIVEFASKNIVDESGDWFDKVTLTRHSKKMQESLKLFEKTATEMKQLQQRIEAVYEEIGETLSKYYEIGGEETKTPIVQEKNKNQ
jgi:predicted nucleic acid binding AN1-type Zn finger protein